MAVYFLELLQSISDLCFDEKLFKVMTTEGNVVVLT